MSAAIALAAYATLLAVLGPRSLERAAWTVRAPRLAIACWQALSLAVVASAVLAGLVLAVPMVRISGGLAEVLHACGMAMRDRYSTSGGAAVSTLGATFALAVAARTLWCFGRGLASARADRSRHRRMLAALGAAPDTSGISIVDDARPAAYCLPGRGHRIVLTSAALAKLGPQELAAVVAHERAHVRGRHHLLVAFAAALATAFPRIRLFAAAKSQTERLVELAADDAACASTDQFTVAGALLSMAGPGVPAVALGAGGDVADRVRRLIAERRPLPRAAVWFGAGAALAMVVVPVVMASEPALAVAGMHYCPLPPRVCVTR